MTQDYIVIHHSLTEDGKVPNWGSIRRYHKSKGWKDVGYHYGIEKVGDKYEILKGRMDDEDGAHTIGFNFNGIGICVIGDFDKNEPSKEQYDVLIRLVRSLMVIYNIPKERVIGHCETYAMLHKIPEKTCPGVMLKMSRFRDML